MADRDVRSIEGCGKPRITRRATSALEFIHDVVLSYSGDDCLGWPFYRDADGYGRVRAQGKIRRVSRYVCRAVHGEPSSEDLVAAHSCGHGHLGCVNPRHLRWATPAENSADMVKHGRSTRGSCRNPIKTQKLSVDDVRHIRSLKGKMTQVAIAKMFGVSTPHICRIMRGQNWSNLDAA